MSTRRFHSCFVVDVQASENDIVITDSTRCRWHVKMDSAEAKAEFKAWLKSVFLKGVAQTLTVFEYVEAGYEPDVEYQIVKFYNCQKQDQLNG